MAKRKNDWQDTDKVLGMFGDKAGPAIRAYRAFVEKGITQGKRSDLTGGGLVRNAGGWAAVKALKRPKIFQSRGPQPFMLLGGKKAGNYHVISSPQTNNFSSGCQQISNSRREAGKG